MVLTERKTLEAYVKTGTGTHVADREGNAPPGGHFSVYETLRRIPSTPRQAWTRAVHVLQPTTGNVVIAKAKGSGGDAALGARASSTSSSTTSTTGSASRSTAGSSSSRGEGRLAALAPPQPRTLYSGGRIDAFAQDADSIAAGHAVHVKQLLDWDDRASSAGSPPR